jgi:hypothetical protein
VSQLVSVARPLLLLLSVAAGGFQLIIERRTIEVIGSGGDIQRTI